VGIDKISIQVTYTEITATAFAGGTFRTELVEQRVMGINAERIDDLNDFVHNLPGKMLVEDADDMLDAFANKDPLYSMPVSALASGVACAGFAFLNQGGWVECLAVLVAAFVGQAVRRQMLVRRYQHFFTWLVCGVVASGVYMGIVGLLGAAGLIEGNHQGGVISAILFLIPGFPMVTAMLDLVRQDFSSALSRAAYVLMVMASAGVAVWTVTFLFNWQVEATDVSVPTGWVLHVLRCLCSFVAAYGFSMLFNAGAKASTLAAVVGALANTGRLILIDEFHVPWQLAVGLAAVIIGVLAQLFVTRASLSRVALSVPAVVIMIPGVPFYRAISALNDRAVDANVAVGQAAANLAEVFFVITAIGVGLAMARILTDHNWRHDVSTSGHITLPESHGSASEPLKRRD